MNRLKTHPGEILREILEERGVTQQTAAAKLGVSFKTVNEVVNARRAVSPEMALRLARVFGGSARFWMNLQIAWDLERAEEARGKSIARLERLARAV